MKDKKEDEEEFQQTRQHQKEVSFWLYKLARSVQRKRTLSLLIYTILCLKSVDVRKRQVAILVRSPREMSQTDRILPRYILSRVRVSVRPRIFLYAKKPQTRLARMLYISKSCMDPLCGQVNNWIGNCRTDSAGWRRANASGY